MNENIEMNPESKIESYCNSVIKHGINSVDSNVIHLLASKGGYVSTSTGGSLTEEEAYAINFCNYSYGGSSYSASASASASSGRQYYEENNSSAAGDPSSGALMSTGAFATPKGARKRTMNNVRAGVKTLLPATESFEDFKLRILNLAINAGDCYKDLTPAFTTEGGEVEDDALNTEEVETGTTSTGIGATGRAKKLALKASVKKEIFDQLLVYMFDLTREVATKTLSTDPNAAAKDALKRKVITFFYKNGFPTRKKGEDPKTKPINDTNNVTTSIKNFVEENYFVCPKGRHFKYNLHMSEDDRHKFPELGIDGINIIYDAAGVLPQNIFLPGSYKIICTPGSYIDPGTKIKNETELENIEKRIGIIPNELNNIAARYSIGDNILRKYGLNDIIRSIDISYNGLTKGGKESPRPYDSFNIFFKINTVKSENILSKGEDINKIHFNPTTINSGFSMRDLNGIYTNQAIDIPQETLHISAAEYFKGNANKNKFIHTYYERFIHEKENPRPEDYKITNEFIKFIIIKELGDTLQVAWLDKLTQEPIYVGANNKKITKENTFVMTGDAMLIARCILNGYNCIYLTGASSTFYLSNVAMDTLPLLSEKLPELVPNPIKERMQKTPGPKVAPKTPGALGVPTMVVEEPRVGFVEDPNPVLNEYLMHNYGVINNLIEKGNAETTIAGKNIWFYFAAYLKHHTDVMHAALKASGADAETIRLFYLNRLGKENKKALDHFLNINRQIDIINIPNEPILRYNEEKTKNYQCFTNKYDVLLRVEEGIKTSYYYGTYDDLFNSITNHMIDEEEKGKFYIKYYNPIIYPTELVNNITKINTIVENFNTYNPLYKTNIDEINSRLYGVEYFLHKLQTESPDADISIGKPMFNELYCYFEKEEEAVTGMAKRVRRQSVFSPQGKKDEQGGGAFVYTERPADYEFETYRPYFANPGYATFYALSRFPRVFLMGYSIMRFLRKVFNVQTSEIDALFKFCEDALDPQLSKLLTEIFMHADEPNYYYNVDSDEELEKQIKYMTDLDTFMYYTIEVVRAVSEGTGLFAARNEILMGTINGMIKDHSRNSGKIINKDDVISKEIQDIILAQRDIFVIVGTKFFRALIQNYNDLADAGKADMVNSISCYEHKIKNTVMSGVEEIMIPLEMLIRQKETKTAIMANDKKVVVAPLVSATAMANGKRVVVAPLVSQIPHVKGLQGMSNDEEEYIPETPPPEREDSMNMANGVVTTPNKAKDMSAFWNSNVQKSSVQKLIKQGLYNRGNPRITNGATSRGRTPYSSTLKVDPRARSQSRRRGTFTGREYNELRRPQLETSYQGYKAGGGERPKTKKRTPLKHKRTRRKERK